ncbi:DNA -binding domain-containing protein [Mesorhizobium sangaii]|uniref:DNA -binding domain-containing protein n=1 Tax=Mesorhizobium sangaii TaxID=505389 RepID=UPI001FE4ED0C|nr:DUF2285 domain-containing protein [Mesorhizobium sangaii]
MVAAALASACLPPEPRGGRLRIVLQALHGSLAGASQEIAIALFGRRRVEEDWSRPGSHLRDQVRRAIQTWPLPDGRRLQTVPGVIVVTA